LAVGVAGGAGFVLYQKYANGGGVTPPTPSKATYDSFADTYLDYTVAAGKTGTPSQVAAACSADPACTCYTVFNATTASRFEIPFSAAGNVARYAPGSTLNFKRPAGTTAESKWGPWSECAGMCGSGEMTRQCAAGTCIGPTSAVCPLPACTTERYFATPIGLQGKKTSGGAFAPDLATCADMCKRTPGCLGTTWVPAASSGGISGECELYYSIDPVATTANQTEAGMTSMGDLRKHSALLLPPSYLGREISADAAEILRTYNTACGPCSTKESLLPLECPAGGVCSPAPAQLRCNAC
jgi:hypothetical protein